MTYRFARFVINLIIWLVSRPEVQGLENVPAEGSFAIAANHLGRLDAILVYYFTNRKDIILLVAEKYQKIPLARWFARKLDAIWVDRFNADFNALRKALDRLRGGGVLVLAPEGTRSPTGALIEGRPGISYLAAKAGVPIIPVGLAGTEDRRVLSYLKRLRRAPIRVRIGRPFYLPPVPRENRDQALKDYTDEIMCRIAALLPPDYRGVYADHPRLQEILASDEAG